MKIKIDYKLHNWNEVINANRNNKYVGAKLKKKEMKDLRYFFIGAQKITKYPIKIICTWHVSNMASDLDNKCIKSVLDCMQEMGILENDNCKHIEEITHKVIKDKKDYLEMEIIDGNSI